MQNRNRKERWWFAIGAAIVALSTHVQVASANVRTTPGMLCGRWTTFGVTQAIWTCPFISDSTLLGSSAGNVYFDFNLSTDVTVQPKACRVNFFTGEAKCRDGAAWTGHGNKDLIVGGGFQGLAGRSNDWDYYYATISLPGSGTQLTMFGMGVAN